MSSDQNERWVKIQRVIRNGDESELADLLRQADDLQTRWTAHALAPMLKLPLFKPSLLRRQQNTLTLFKPTPLAACRTEVYSMIANDSFVGANVHRTRDRAQSALLRSPIELASRCLGCI
jgi:hypothetical protein